jgi:hypothetical protein
MAGRVGRDRGKERFWRGLLREWRRSGLSVREFCIAEGVSEPSFYDWRRMIAQRDQQARRRGPRQPIDDRSTGAGQPEALVGGLPLFVPLTVASAAAVLEVVLERGLTVRVPAGFDAPTLRQLLAVLAEGRPSC